MARQRFGPAARSLLPLHSLADFCLVVRRQVIEAIGGADEEYALGPCWEMDYNIRAARAASRECGWAPPMLTVTHPPTAGVLPKPAGWGEPAAFTRTASAASG